MSRTAKIVLGVLLVIVLVGGAYIGYMVTSPQYVLSGIVKEFNAEGVTALESHLTGNALTLYQTAVKVTENRVVGLVMSLSPTQSVMGVLKRGAGSLKTSYESVQRDWNTASITLRVEAAAGGGEIELEMVRDGLSWQISDVAIPIGSWVVQ